MTDLADELAKEMGLVLVFDPSALSKRAVRCDAWRWMVRMSDALGRTVLDVDQVLGDPSFGDGFVIGALPDLDDPATLGCLLALVREAWGLPHAYAAREVTGAGTHESPRFPPGAERTADGGWVRYGWRVNPGDGSRGAIAGISHAADVEALVAALEAAPQTEGVLVTTEAAP